MLLFGTELGELAFLLIVVQRINENKATIFQPLDQDK